MWPALWLLIKPLLAKAGTAALATATSKAVGNAMSSGQMSPPGDVPQMAPMNLEALLKKKDESDLPKLHLQQY